MEFNITTPAVLFPAVSLLMLAYTNRFLAISTLTRSLKDKFVENAEEKLLIQLRNLRRRLFLIRNMQFFGSIVAVFVRAEYVFIFENRPVTARNIFGIGLVCLIFSLAMSLREIHLSVVALSVELKDIEEELSEKKELLSVKSKS